MLKNKELLNKVKKAGCTFLAGTVIFSFHACNFKTDDDSYAIVDNKLVNEIPLIKEDGSKLQLLLYCNTYTSETNFYIGYIVSDEENFIFEDVMTGLKIDFNDDKKYSNVKFYNIEFSYMCSDFDIKNNCIDVDTAKNILKRQKTKNITVNENWKDTSNYNDNKGNAYVLK